MLRRIGLQNFKCWRELDIELAPITLFFGANSSGKTALLQSLLMLKQTVNSRDPNVHLNFGGGKRDFVDLGSYRDLIFGQTEDKAIGTCLHWDASAHSVIQHRRAYVRPRPGPAVRLEHSVAWRWDNDVLVDHLGYRACGVEKFDCFIRLDRQGPESYRVDHSDSLWSTYATLDLDADSITETEYPDEVPDSPGNCYHLPLNLLLRDSDDQLSYEPQFARAFENLVDKIRYLGPIRQYPQRFYQWTGERKREVVEPDGADTFAALVSSVRDDSALKVEVEKWLRELDLTESLAIKATGSHGRFHEITVNVEGKESALLDAGFGVSQALPVLTLLLSAPEGSIILLEQPELHLHPNAQAALADLLLHVAEERQLQLIVESHSEHIVRRLQRRVAEAQSAFAICENIRMYYCEAGAEGSTATEIDIDRFGQIPNWPERFLGDISGDLHEMLRAALERRSQELESAGSGS